MRYLITVIVLLLVAVSAAAADGVVSARLASGKIPAPTFDQVHHAFTRLVINESGFKSLADQEGILKSLLFGSGGRSDARGTVGGLDYRRLMRRMASHSTRTFPRDSVFLAALTPRLRAHKTRLRTYQNEWTSTFTMDCEQPAGWNASVSGPWAGYPKRCAELIRSTRKVLDGDHEERCTGVPTTWGSHDDRRRAGGADAKGWTEIRCDRPPSVESDPPITECPVLRGGGDEDANRRLLNSTNCARNFFFSWAEKSGGAASGEWASN